MRVNSAAIESLMTAHESGYHGLWIVTGPRQAGKTTVCAEVAAAHRRRGVVTAGVMCPAVFEDEVRTAIDIVDLSNGDRRRMGCLYRDGLQGLRVGRWLMDPKAIAWGNGVLAQIAHADTLIVDELGPLEFDQSGGFTSGMKLLDEGRYRTALVVIRPELVDAARQRWPDARIITVQEGDSGVSDNDESCA